MLMTFKLILKTGSEWTQDAAYELRNEVEKEVIQNLSGATANKVGDNTFLAAVDTSAASFNMTDQIIDCGTKLDEQNVPDDGRWF